MEYTPITSKTIEIDSHDAPSIRLGLTLLLSRVYAELRVLRIARERELDAIEKAQLPWTLRDANREGLIEQVDPWISWVMQIEYQIKQFTF